MRGLGGGRLANPRPLWGPPPLPVGTAPRPREPSPRSLLEVPATVRPSPAPDACPRTLPAPASQPGPGGPVSRPSSVLPTPHPHL